MGLDGSTSSHRSTEEVCGEGGGWWCVDVLCESDEGSLPCVAPEKGVACRSTELRNGPQRLFNTAGVVPEEAAWRMGQHPQVTHLTTLRLGVGIPQ